MSKSTNQHTVKYLKDYKEPDFFINQIDFTIELLPNDSQVTSTLQITRNTTAGAHSRPLVLNGEELKLISVVVDKSKLSNEQYQVDEKSLTIENLPDSFELTTEILIQPQNNTSLMGLYNSRGMFSTQCESEGFRKINYYPTTW